MKVKDAMHKGVDWVSPDTPVTELAKLMCEHDIGAIPIGENDHLIGMVTDRDIVCKGLAQKNFDASRTTAREVMTPGIHCCRDEDDLAKAVRHMEALQIRIEGTCRSLYAQQAAIIPTAEKKLSDGSFFPVTIVTQH